MDVLLQRHCAKHIYIVPEGLRELMSDITREVLRNQPEQICKFIADYLDALMITRENARVAAKFVESMTQVATTITEFLSEMGISRVEADEAANVIQASFKKHFGEKSAKEKLEGVEEPTEETIVADILEEAKIPAEQMDKAATIIQSAYRQFKEREEQAADMLKGMIDWRIAARSTLRLYRQTGVTYEEANRAANMIKAAYKGYYTRRIIKRLLLGEEPVEEPIEEEEFSFSVSMPEGEQESFYPLEDISHAEELTGESLTLHEEGSIEMIGKLVIEDLLSRVIPDGAGEADTQTNTVPSTVEDVTEQDISTYTDTTAGNETTTVDASVTE